MSSVISFPLVRTYILYHVTTNIWNFDGITVLPLNVIILKIILIPPKNHPCLYFMNFSLSVRPVYIYIDIYIYIILKFIGKLPSSISLM